MPGEGVVHVVDDDEAMRESLAFLCRSAKLRSEVYESATAFLDRLPQAEPGCVLTDVRMPEISGIDLLKQLRRLKVAMPVIVITGHGDVALAVEAMKCGASDFLEKPFDGELLLAALHTALTDQTSVLEVGKERAELAQRMAALSQRERQVLDGLIAGRANKAIAFDLGISPRTIEIYRANVMTKMKAQSLSELVRMAIIVGVLNDRN